MEVYTHANSTGDTELNISSLIVINIIIIILIFLTPGTSFPKTNINLNLKYIMYIIMEVDVVGTCT